MKQTAVEWLIQALIMSEDNPNYNQWAIEKAKAMEKEQIIEARDTSPYSMFERIGEAEEYYNETYKQK